MSTAKAVLSAAASALLFRSIANEFLPADLHNFLHSKLQIVNQYFSSQLTIVIEEFQGHSVNQVFDAAKLYLGNRATTGSAQRFRVGKSEKEKTIGVSLDRNEQVYDVFKDVTLKWKLVYTQIPVSNKYRDNDIGDYNASLRSEVRHFELCFHKKHKDTVLNLYIPQVLEKAKAIKEGSNLVKIHTVIHQRWDANDFVLEHPMTFNTLAIDSELKNAIMEDLENFMNGKEYYRRIGKVWKRGYLLYGPPGTGKSSLIAAMANQLKFDIYDLDLSSIHQNSDLRFLLLTLPSRSMLVVEDIDCSVKLQNRESSEQARNQGDDKNKVTLSGLLNFIDGLWSCCGEGRIIVFSTNHKEKLDPALLRPGRMDTHVHLSYCNASVFKQLAFNYLGISHHPHLFEEIEELIMEVNVTPAEVAGELMKSTNAEVSLRELVKFLRKKMIEQSEESNQQDSL